MLQPPRFENPFLSTVRYSRGFLFLLHLGIEHLFIWSSSYISFFFRLEFLIAKFLSGGAYCTTVDVQEYTRTLKKKNIGAQCKQQYILVLLTTDAFAIRTIHFLCSADHEEVW